MEPYTNGSRGCAYYFAYGANMSETTMKKRAREAKFVAPAALDHFEIEFNKPSKKDPTIGFANVVPRWGSRVEGILYEIGPSDLKSLDLREGYPEHYQRTVLRVTTGAATYHAVVYVAARTADGLRVDDMYAERVMEGARLLSDEYKDSLLRKIKWK